MNGDINPHLIELVYNAVLKSFWRKQALRKFLRNCRISESFLSTWNVEESKREFLDRLFTELPKSERGRAAIFKIAQFLLEQKSFPDLEHWENSADMIRDASQSLNILKKYLEEKQQEKQEQKEREEIQKRGRERKEEIKKFESDLQKLDLRLQELSYRLGTQQAGYDFQNWFFDLLDFNEIPNRRPYNYAGRQIDGSLTLAGTTYLVELKFTTEQSGATDIDSFLKKVNDKADNTMGIMVSISGYSMVAINSASGPKTPLLLLDHGHLYLILGGILKFTDVVERVRRHASQTSEAYLSVSKFGDV